MCPLSNESLFSFSINCVYIGDSACVLSTDHWTCALMASSSSHLTLSGCRHPPDTSLGSWRSHSPTSPSSSAKELRDVSSTQVYNTLQLPGALATISSIRIHFCHLSQRSIFACRLCPFYQLPAFVSLKYYLQSIKTLSQDGLLLAGHFWLYTSGRVFNFGWCLFSCVQPAGRVSFSQIDAFHSIRIIQMPVKVGERSDLGLFGVIRKCHSDGHKRERKRGLCSGSLLYISFISVYFPNSLLKAPLIQMHLPCKQQNETTLQWTGRPCLPSTVPLQC